MDAEDYQQIEETDMSHWHSFFGVNSTNKNQRDKLRKLSRKYIMETLAEQLDKNLSEMGISGYTIERVTSTDSGTPIDSDKDPTVILVNYESVCNDRVGYILPRVKVEISCLSMSEPSEEMPIESLISKSYPAEDSSISCRVKTVLPSRTFLEKAFLLNEEFQKGSLAIGPSSTASISTIERNTSPKKSRRSPSQSAGE